MNDGAPGPGWWIASDGQWYPPETHPTAAPTPLAGSRRPAGPAEDPEWAPLLPLSAVVPHVGGVLVVSGPLIQQSGAPEGWPVLPSPPAFAPSPSSAPLSFVAPGALPPLPAFGATPVAVPTNNGRPLGWGPLASPAASMAARQSSPGPPAGTYNPYGWPHLDATVRRPRLAPWWKRLLAVLLDGVIVYIPTQIVERVAISTGHIYTLLAFFNPFASLGQLIEAVLIVWGPALVYYGCLNGSANGQTVGKRALGIAVRSARTGDSIGVLRGVTREAVVVGLGLIPIVLGVRLGLFLGSLEGVLVLPALLNYLWPLWDARHQAWHDKVVGSVVVEAP